jgi:NAD(P)H-quinone oxidoreductase subunit 5
VTKTLNAHSVEKELPLLNFGYLRLVQSVLWTLTVPAFSLLIAQSFSQARTLDVLSTVLAGVQVGVGLRFDILSTLLFFMITLLGAIIGQYSIRYLAGEKRQPYFFKHLLGIVLSASAMVLSSNLLMFFVMWLTVSYNLHKLLTYYNDRPAALLAAKKKIIISRIGDLAILSAIVLTYRLFGSFEFSEIFANAAAMSARPETQGVMSAIGLLIVIGALTKSAQFPFHFWLPETMETPTPVSALMHAGVINAGGFLVIRMSPILENAAFSNMILAVVGAISAAFGALCMITQNDIKKKLAYSTISQMGMMMTACGLGVYSIALFHIFAHSFYKAYAFLSTGKLVEESKKVELPLTPASTFQILTVGALGVAAILGSLYVADAAYLPVVAYGVLLALGFAQNLSAFNTHHPFKARITTAIAAVMACAVVAYGLIEYLLSVYVEQVVPTGMSPHLDHPVLITTSLIVYAIFFGTFWLSARLMNPDTETLRSLYMYLRNGGYLGIRSSALLARLNSNSPA